MIDFLQFDKEHLRNLILPFTQTSDFISLFGQKNIENINIVSPVSKNFDANFTLTSNQFYFGFCNGSFNSVDFTTTLFSPVCNTILTDTVSPFNTSFLPDNTQLNLFNSIELDFCTLDFQGFF